MTITVDDMKHKLWTLDDVEKKLQVDEPVNAVPFTVGDALRFEADPAWNHGLAVKATDDAAGVYFLHGLGAHQRRYQLSLGTLQEMCSAFGFKKDYVVDCPPELLVPHMNYWYREGFFVKSRKGKDFQIVINRDDRAVAFTKQGLVPFSNLTLLRIAVEQIHKRTGWDHEIIMVDYKLHHTLRQTTLRLIVPNDVRQLQDTGEDDDEWSRGISIKNSLTGTSQTSYEGYLFRWLCTNGMTDTRASSGAYTRRKDAGEAEVYEWARHAVDDALSGLAGAFDNLQALTRVGIEGNLADTLRDVFEHHRISLQHRPKIISYLEQYPGEITMYVIMNAITQVANDPTLEPTTVDSLLRAGADFAHTADQRCGACHRLYHHH
jgi:hypothetical protein